jgi:hypothetical protein
LGTNQSPTSTVPRLCETPLTLPTARPIAGREQPERNRPASAQNNVSVEQHAGKQPVASSLAVRPPVNEGQCVASLPNTSPPPVNKVSVSIDKPVVLGQAADSQACQEVSGGDGPAQSQRASSAVSSVVKSNGLGGGSLASTPLSLPRGGGGGGDASPPFRFRVGDKVLAFWEQDRKWRHGIVEQIYKVRCTVLPILAGLWIRIGSGFSDFVDPDPYCESRSRIRIQGQEN